MGTRVAREKLIFPEQSRSERFNVTVICEPCEHPYELGNMPSPAFCASYEPAACFSISTA